MFGDRGDPIDTILRGNADLEPACAAVEAGAAFRARLAQTYASFDVLQTYAVRVDGFDGLFYQQARCRQEAIDLVLQVAILDPNLRRDVKAQVVG